jgi:hypothetical protein
MRNSRSRNFTFEHAQCGTIYYTGVESFLNSNSGHNHVIGVTRSLSVNRLATNITHGCTSDTATPFRVGNGSTCRPYLARDLRGQKDRDILSWGWRHEAPQAQALPR